jgi:hypothetical protein
MLVVAYATGRASHARQVKGDEPDKKGYPGPPGWGLGVRLTTSPCKKLIVTKPYSKPRNVMIPDGDKGLEGRTGSTDWKHGLETRA